MRWVFFSLLGINSLMFAWGVMFDSDQPSTAEVRESPFPYRGLPELQMLGEVGDTQAVGAREERTPSAVASFDVSKINSKTLCEMVGPFKDTAMAEDFRSRLSAIDIASSIKDLELPAGPGYWVYLKPAENRRAALRRLAELQARGIDSYVIPKGEFENGISLGMFSQENLAKARLAEMVAIGLEPYLDTIERTYRETWVMLNPGEERKMSNLTWDRVMEGLNHLERRQNFCLDVASQDNIH